MVLNMAKIEIARRQRHRMAYSSLAWKELATEMKNQAERGFSVNNQRIKK